MIILVTGANGGLGLAVAKRFLSSRDNFVWLAVHRRSDQATKLHEAHPNSTSLVQLDVVDPSAWEEAISEIESRSGRLDVLVNNAGFHQDALLATMSDAQWHNVINTNLNGVFYGCRSVVKIMMSQRFGRIINISSLSALLAPRGQTNYAAAKAGVIALTQSLAKETARSGITVNAICPGYIETEALAGLGGDDRKRLLAEIPMRRLGQPDEVAAAVEFLACHDAGYITGSALKIDGGIY